MMQELRKFDRYEEFKQEFDREYRSQVEGYIKMGYLLKVARDTDILQESSYKSIAEFAWNEYKLRDDAVSRMIVANDRFSEGGYSDRIEEKYKGYGASLLAEMITMSDAVIDALPEGTTREVLREVKKEIREESKVTELEVLIEGEDAQQQGMETNLAKMLHRYYRDNSREYPVMYKILKEMGNAGTEAAMQILAPNGVCVKFARVQGIGKFMLSIKGRDQNLELLNVRENQTESYTWEECLNVLRGLCPAPQMKKSWESVYGEQYPEEKKEFAPAQEKTPTAPGNTDHAKKQEPQKEEAIKERERKEPEAEDRKPEETTWKPESEPRPAPEPEPEPKPEDDTEPEKSETIPEAQVNTGEGAIQSSIENFPEVIPAGYIKCHDGSEVAETEGHRLWKEAAGHAERLFNTLDTGKYPVDTKILTEMRETAESLLNAIERLGKLGIE